MSKLDARPKHMMSWGFDLFAGEIPVATLNMRWFKEGGTFQWNGTEFRLGREGLCSGDFFLANDDRVVARARKTSPLTRTFRLTIQDREMILAANSPFVRSFQLTEQGTNIGTIRPNHFLTRKCVIDLPDKLDIPEQIFIFWLVLLMWRRASRSND